MRKPEFCLCENKGADQLCSNCTADLRLCFRYTDSTFSLLLILKLSRFYVSSVTVQAGLCRTCSETRRPVFSRRGSNCLELAFRINCFSISVLALYPRSFTGPVVGTRRLNQSSSTVHVLYIVKA